MSTETKMEMVAQMTYRFATVVGGWFLIEIFRKALRLGVELGFVIVTNW